MPSAVICDMDGLLLDTERTSLQFWQQAAAEIGKEIPAEVFGKWVGRRVEENEPLAYRDLGEDFPFWEVRKRRTELMSELLSSGNLPVKAGARELLAAIAASNTQLAVATSTSTAEACEFLKKLDLYSHLDLLVGGDQVSNGKPQPDIFLKVAKQLGVEAARCVVLEDSGPGIRAATAAGMQVIAVRDIAVLEEAERALAHSYCEDLHQALPIVIELCSLP